MPDNFDAYYKWLGIPPEEQPPHHYRLLGVRPLEADADVIANAADQRMTHVRTFQSGKHAAHSQKILNEISAAKLCLLNSARKSEYDKLLRGKLAAHAGAPPGHSAAPPGPPAHVAMGAGPPPQTVHSQPRYEQPLAPAATTSVAAPEPSGTTDFGQIVHESSRRRTSTRSRRQTTSWVGPFIIVVGLLAALGVAVVVLKNRGADELLAKHDTGIGKHKSKTEHSADSAGDGAGSHKDHDPDAKGASSGHTSSGDEPAAPDPDAVQKLLKRVGASVKAGQIEATDTVGGVGGAVFRDLPRNGALLSGFDVTLQPAEDGGSPALSSVRAWFQTGERAVSRYPVVHGSEQETVMKIRAKSGYAIGALELVPGDRVTGFKVQFCAITSTGLSSDKCYYTDWYGRAADKSTVRLGGNGRPIIGIAGTSSSVVNRLGLILEAADSEKPKTVRPKAENPHTAGMPPESTEPEPAPPPRTFPQQPVANDQQHLPAPNAEAQQTARTTVHELFKDQFAEISASTAKPTVATEKKMKLAQALFHAAENENDPAARYVLLDEARKLAIQVGDSTAVLEAIYALGSRFAIDDVELTLESLEEAVKAPAGPPYKRRLAENALMLINKAVVRERFDAAEKLESLGLKAASTGQDSLLHQQVIWRRARLTEQRKAYDDAQAALATLKGNPSDAAANLAAGRYRCFFQEDWKAGLPLLAKGSDATLKQLADQESSAPTDALEQVKMGDEWSSAARTDESLAPYYQRRARQWYETAMSRLAGVTRLGVQAKLDKMLGGHGLRGEYFAGAGNFDEHLKTRIDQRVDFHWGNSTPEDLPSNQFTARWTGWLAAPPTKGKAGQHVIVVDHDAGARLWIDGKIVIDDWGGAGRREIPYTLLATKPRNIKLEYFSSGNSGKARISLRWFQKEGFPEQPIPPEALFQERNAADKGYAPLPVPKPGDNSPLVVYVPSDVPAIQINGPEKATPPPDQQ